MLLLPHRRLRQLQLHLVLVALWRRQRPRQPAANEFCAAAELGDDPSEFLAQTLVTVLSEQGDFVVIVVVAAVGVIEAQSVLLPFQFDLEPVLGNSRHHQTLAFFATLTKSIFLQLKFLLHFSPALEKRFIFVPAQIAQVCDVATVKRGQA